MKPVTRRVKAAPATARRAGAAPSASTRKAAPARGALRPEPAVKSRTLGKRIPKASEVLVHTLLDHIVKAGLTDGDRLPQESEMVAQYGVARATVREALRILEINGLVRLRSGPGGGPTVRATTAADFARVMGLFLQAEKITLAELFLARGLIEPSLARDAAQRQDPAFLQRAADLLQRGRTVDIGNDAEYVKVTREFHEVMVQGSANRVFMLIGLALMAMFIGKLDHAIHPPENRRRILQEHEDILAAILAKDAAKAETLMHAHMNVVQASIAARYPAAHQDLISWL